MSKLFKKLIESYRVHDDLGLPDETRDEEIEKFGKKIAEKQEALKHILMLRNALLVADVSSEDLNKAEENLRAELGCTAPTEASRDLTMIERVLRPSYLEVEGLPRNKITLGFEDTLQHEELQYLIGMGAQISIGPYSEVVGENLCGDAICFDLIVTINL